MFKEHNGHEFVPLDEVTTVIRQNIEDLQALLINTKSINEENRSFIDHQANEIIRLKTQQLANIDRGFDEVIARLEQKRDFLKHEFDKKYEDEL